VSEISTSQTVATLIVSEWRRYIRFLRRPTLAVKPADAEPSAYQATVALFLADAAAMLLLAGWAALYVAAGGEMPRHALDGLKLTPPLIFMLIVVGPVLEEAAFRGWLTGTPRSLTLYGAFIVVATAVMLTGSFNRTSAATLFFFLVVAVAASFQWLPDKVPVRRFGAAFPWLFWVSSLTFGLVHLTNLNVGHNRFAVLWVAPQLISGTIFGYARVRVGMWSNIVLHVAHNAVMVLVAVSVGMGS
jgi:membrane protease YdiL (CAAX protease family)